MSTIPNFFIVGTPKAGTTSLYHYLDQHPEIYMSPIKETDYFSWPEIKVQGLYYDVKSVYSIKEYEDQFKRVTGEKAIGEASVSYLFYPGVPSKIKNFNPGAKIVIVLRNPVDRGFSHYLMDKRLGYTNLSYEDIVFKKGRHKNLHLFYQQHVELGLYYEQLQRYLSTFSAEKVKVLFFEDVANNLKEVIKDVYNFLEVDKEYIAATYNKHNVFETARNSLVAKLYARKKVRETVKGVLGPGAGTRIKKLFFLKEKPVLSPDLKNHLINIYKTDIIKTSELLRKDLSQWLA